MGCTACIPRKVNNPTQIITTNELVIYSHDAELGENEANIRNDEKSVMNDSASESTNNERERIQERPKVRFEHVVSVSSNGTQPISFSESRRQKRRGRKANNYREFRDNGHRSFAGHSFIREVFHEKLGLRYETHEEKMQIKGKTYNPDIKFTWNRFGEEQILVYCEIKCVKQGAFTKLVQQVQTGRINIENKHALFVGFLMREKKNSKVILGSNDPLGNFQKLEFVICEGFHAIEFARLVKISGHFRIHPLFRCLDTYSENQSFEPGVKS